MFGLLAKSNPTIFERARSNIIYFNELPDWHNLQTGIISNFDFKALFYHYISLAKGNLNLMENNKKFTYKTVFYCIRGLLSAELEVAGDCLQLRKFLCVLGDQPVTLQFTFN